MYSTVPNTLIDSCTWHLPEEAPPPYLAKAAHHLLHQGPHGGNVDDLEVIHVDGAIHVDVLAYLS